MRSLISRIAISLIAFCVGLGLASLCHVLFVHRVTRLELIANQTKQVCAPKTRNEADNDVSVTGRYTNFNYAYSVLVPRGMMGATSPAPMPQHGFGINLLNPASSAWTEEKGWPQAYLWVDGSYNALLLTSFEEVINEQLKWTRDDYSHVRLIGTAPTRLGRLPAVRFVMAYGNSGEEMIEDQIVSFRRESDIIYSLSLRTPASRYDQDKRLIAEMQRTWLVDPLPDDYPLPPVYGENYK